MDISTEIVTNGATKPDEQPSLPRYACKQCQRDCVQPIESIYFKERKELLAHYLSEHDDDLYSQLGTQLANYKPSNYDSIKVNPYDLLNTAKTQVEVVKKTELITTPQPIQQRKIAQKKNLQQSQPSSIDSQPLVVPRKKVYFKNSDNEDTDNDQDDDALNQTATTFKKDIDLEHKLKTASEQDLKYFNFTNIEKYKYEQVIDELKLSERLATLYSSKPLIKAQEVKKNTIVWAQWRNKGKLIWWPSKVENIVRKSSRLIITIRYFEDSKFSHYAFKMELSKIQLFFHPVEDHFKHKIETASALKERRLEFFSAYTSALKSFEELCNKKEDDINQSITNQTLNDEKILINKKKYSLDQIKQLAKQEPSEKLIKTKKEREDKSKLLLELIRSEECKNYIVSILNSEIECHKSVDYLNGDLKTRKQLQQISPGPLVDEDQREVANMVNELSRLHFTQKPANLLNYEHDILYPEAVIWAIKKKYNLNYKRAELKYNEGFKRTPEEILKQKCNEYLSDQQLNEDTDQSDTMQTDNVLEDSSNVNKSDESMPFESNDLSLSTIESNVTKDETADSHEEVNNPEQVTDENIANNIEVNEQEGSGIDL